jgi:MoaA/NifB/PqqE/SkfB family radical SAM enzyme
VDSTNDPIRGKDNYARDILKIIDALCMKANYSTKVIVTMIDTGNKEDDFKQLKHDLAGSDAYIYMKSLDQAWLVGGEKPKSIHWSEFCQIPWSSMTIKSDGLAASCEEDFNNEIILGDAKVDTLYDIWNGKKYADLRKAHLELWPGIHCTERCDMRKIGELLGS